MLTNPNVLQALVAETTKSSLVIKRKTLADADDAAQSASIEFFTVVHPEHVEKFDFDDIETGKQIAGESMRCIAMDNEGTKKEVLIVFTVVNRGVINEPMQKLRSIAKENIGKPIRVVGAFGKTDLTKGKFYPREITLVTTAGLLTSENPEKVVTERITV